MKSKNRQFREHCEKWRKRLWLQDWSVDFDYPETIDEGAHSGWQSMMRVKSKPAYRRATIEIAQDSVVDMSEKDMNRHALHEMLHVALSPLNQMCIDAITTMPQKQFDAFDLWRWKENELVTEHMTNVLLSAYKT